MEALVNSVNCECVTEHDIIPGSSLASNLYDTGGVLLAWYVSTGLHANLIVSAPKSVMIGRCVGNLGGAKYEQKRVKLKPKRNITWASNKLRVTNNMCFNPDHSC